MRSQRESQRKPLPIHVHGNERVRTRAACSQQRTQANAAQAEDSRRFPPAPPLPCSPRRPRPSAPHSRTVPRSPEAAPGQSSRPSAPTPPRTPRTPKRPDDAVRGQPLHRPTSGVHLRLAAHPPLFAAAPGSHRAGLPVAQGLAVAADGNEREHHPVANRRGLPLPSPSSTTSPAASCPSTIGKGRGREPSMTDKIRVTQARRKNPHQQFTLPQEPARIDCSRSAADATGYTGRREPALAQNRRV